MRSMRCPRPYCGHEWDYTGNKKYGATCPGCKTTVSFRTSLVGKLLDKGVKARRKEENQAR